MPETNPTMRELKSRSQLLKPAIKLGKAGMNAEFLAEFRRIIARKNLVKIRFEGFKNERKSLSKEIAETTGSLLVQQVGHTAVYYSARSVVEFAT